MRLCPRVPVVPSLLLTATLFWALSPSAAERPGWAPTPQLSCLEDRLQAWSKGVPWAPPQAPGIVSPSLSPLPQKEVQALQPGIPDRSQNSPFPSSCALGRKPNIRPFLKPDGPILLSPGTPAAARQAGPALPAVGIRGSPQNLLKRSPSSLLSLLAVSAKISRKTWVLSPALPYPRSSHRLSVPYPT